MKAIVILLLLSTAVSVGAQPKQLQYGVHKVGFAYTVLFDNSRQAVQEQSHKENGRIIAVNMWYPASLVKGTPNTFADYVHLVGRELADTVTNDSWQQKGVDKYYEWPASAGADKNSFTAFLAQKTPMRAYREASFSGTDYPVIMLVHGFAADYAYLAEYIASHGAIVMHVPTKGTLRYELDYAEKGLESQVLDYEFALAFLKNKFSLPAKTVAAVGFSFGGQSALALAIRNQNVRAVVSLDGGIGSDFGGTLLSRQSFYDSTRITAPILHLYNPKDQYTSLSWLNSYALTSRCYIALNNVEHGYFTSAGVLRRQLPDIMGKTAPDPGDAYEALMLLTNEFIQTQFKQASWENRLAGLKKENLWMDHPIGKIDIRKAGNFPAE